MPLFGLSISLCIKDIVAGKVKVEDVDTIFGRTKARTAEHWEEVIREYRATYWAEDPDAGEAALRRLLREGRIVQPILMEGVRPDSQATGDHWTASREAIVDQNWGRGRAR